VLIRSVISLQFLFLRLLSVLHSSDEQSNFLFSRSTCQNLDGLLLVVDEF